VKLRTSIGLATAATVGVLVFGGVQLASAQEDTTTTTQDPATDGSTTDGSTNGDSGGQRAGDCPQKDASSASSESAAA